MAVGVSFVGIFVIAALIIVPAILIPVLVTRSRNQNNIPTNMNPQNVPYQPAPQLVCGRCGAPIQEGSAFCAVCGVRVVE